MKRLAAGLPPNPSPHVAAFEALGAPTRTDALMHAHAEAYLADALRRWETGD